VHAVPAEGQRASCAGPEEREHCGIGAPNVLPTGFHADSGGFQLVMLADHPTAFMAYTRRNYEAMAKGRGLYENR